MDAEAECAGCLCEGFAESLERFVRSLAVKLRNDDHLSPVHLGSRKSATICAFSMDFLARRTSLGKGKVSLPFCCLLPPLLLLPAGPSLRHHPVPLPRSFLCLLCGLAGRWGVFLPVDHSGCSERCLCVLGQRGLLLSPRAALTLTGWTPGDLSSSRSPRWFSSFF